MPTGSRMLAKGFTLAESLVAATVLAVAVAASLLPFTVGAQYQQVEARRTLAAGLAQELMEEILLRPFEEPDDGDMDFEPVGNFGPDAGETDRADFDAVDDYAGYNEQAGSIVGGNGEVVTAGAAVGLSRDVTVEYVTLAGQDGADDPTILRVTVRVRYRGDTLVTLTRLVQDPR